VAPIITGIIIVVVVVLQVVFLKKRITHILNCVLCLGIWELLFSI
jgi:hypothetical protein